MFSSLTRTALRQGVRLSHRAIATTAVRPAADAGGLTVQERDKYYPKLGTCHFGYRSVPLS